MPETLIIDNMGTFAVTKLMGPLYRVTFCATGSTVPIELRLQKELPADAGPTSELAKILGEIGRIIYSGFRADDYVNGREPLMLAHGYKRVPTPKRVKNVPDLVIADDMEKP
jgi:hypothetical protein